MAYRDGVESGDSTGTTWCGSWQSGMSSAADSNGYGAVIYASANDYAAGTSDLRRWRRAWPVTVLLQSEEQLTRLAGLSVAGPREGRRYRPI